jgi:hypothetical protein
LTNWLWLTLFLVGNSTGILEGLVLFINAAAIGW